MLNGKKTYIGAAAWGILNILVAFGILAPETAEPWIQFAQSFTAIGIGHKLAKKG